MTYYSQLSADAFAKIKTKTRLIEPRLNDPAHRKIRPGDLLVMTNRANGDEVVAKVVGILRYPSFKELFASNPLERFGADDERELLTEMHHYYSATQEMEHGVLGVKLHVLKA